MLTASPNTYCDPAKLNNTLAMLDRWNAEQVAWNRCPAYMRKPGYKQGIDAVLINRKGSLEPVALSDLTGPELDRLLTVPALTGRA
jgi:hypothetical protein